MPRALSTGDKRPHMLELLGVDAISLEELGKRNGGRLFGVCHSIQILEMLEIFEVCQPPDVVDRDQDRDGLAASRETDSP